MNRSRRLASSLALLALAAAAAPAQTLLSRHVGWTEMAEMNAPKATPPVPLNPYGYPPLPISNPIAGWTPAGTPTSAVLGPPTAFPYGDLAFDNLRGAIVETDGDFVAIHTHEAYLGTPGLAAVNVVVPKPAFLGRLTGIAVDAASGRIWMTDGVALQSVWSAAPTVPASFPVAFGFTIVAPPMTGLDWDPVAAQIVGCDAGGNVYRCTTAGGAVGSQPWLAGISGWINGPATDVAVPHIPLGLGNFEAMVQWVGFGVFAHHNDGGGWVGSSWSYGSSVPPPSTEAGLALTYGHENLSDGIGCGCPYTSFRPMAPAVIGQTAAGLALHGVAPGTPTLLLLDLESWAPPGYSADCFWALRISPTPLVMLAGAADATGRAAFPMPLNVPASLAGLQVFAQAGFLCGTATSSFSMTRALWFQLGLP